VGLKKILFKQVADKTKEPLLLLLFLLQNVTGKLLLGIAWDTTVQDIHHQTKRMQGFDTLWLPGMDSCGIATQGKSRG